jgi:hypothetical protein
VRAPPIEETEREDMMRGSGSLSSVCYPLGARKISIDRENEMDGRISPLSGLLHADSDATVALNVNWAASMPSRLATPFHSWTRHCIHDTLT